MECRALVGCLVEWFRVATAAGLCYGSLGSDTGGSIRFPSAANGVTGLKPTWGRVSRHGVFELAATLDHIGPMARSAADCGAMLGVIAGSDPNDPTSVLDPVPNYLAGMRRGLRDLRVGVDHAWNTTRVDGVMTDAVSAALAMVRELGAEIRDVSFPEVGQIIADWFPLCSVQTAVAHEATYPARKSEYGPALSSFIEPGLALSGVDYQKIILRRADFRGRVAALFQGIDLLLVPAQSFCIADHRAVGTPRRGHRNVERPGALHHAVQHDGQPDDYFALWLHGCRNPGGIPVRRSSSRRGDAGARRLCLSDCDRLAPQASDGGVGMIDSINAFVPGPRIRIDGTRRPAQRPQVCCEGPVRRRRRPTGGGNHDWARANPVPTKHAWAVQTLLDAGATLIGKTITDEVSLGILGENAFDGTPLNSAAPDRVPGGSSSGSAAAVAAGLCDTALGTDTGGSVRVPASFCGLYGIRPTHGRLNLAGMLPQAPSSDTTGWFARDAETFARVSSVLLGEAPAATLPQHPADRRRCIRLRRCGCRHRPAADARQAETTDRIGTG